jgi:glycosyltransferase involved in cell wall biosynthesis
MKVLILTPWKNTWIPYYKKVFEERGHSVRVAHDSKQLIRADVYLHMWACMSYPIPNAVNIMFMRRFEFFEYNWKEYPWDKIDSLVFCNTFFKREFDSYFKHIHNTELIYNAVDTEVWAEKPHSKGVKVGMACHVHPKKNLPLAAQIIKALGKPFELHITGEWQDSATVAYLHWAAKEMDLDITLYGHTENMAKWWADKDYCLSTSLSEGNPNNILEAMAQGIRPVVHSWPGAIDQFPSRCIFNGVYEAVGQITGDYGSGYREHVEKYYSLLNFRDVVKIAETATQNRKEKEHEREQERDIRRAV